MEDCIFIHEEHRGEQAILIGIAVRHLESNGIDLPPGLLNWKDHTKRIEERNARKEKAKLESDMKIYKNGRWFDMPYSDADLITRLRHWLIQLIAGKSTVILNANIYVGDRTDEEFPIRCNGINGALFSNVKHYIPGEMQIEYRAD